MSAPVNRAAPICWAVIPDGPGAWRKQLLLHTDPVPLAAVATTKTEEGADREIERLRTEHAEDTAFKARQLPLLLDPASDDAGEAGAAKALEAAEAAWRETAWQWIVSRVAGVRFTSDDMLGASGFPPRHPHAVGAILKNAAVAGLIVKTGDYVTSERESCRGAVVAVWARTTMEG